MRGRALIGLGLGALLLGAVAVWSLRGDDAARRDATEASKADEPRDREASEAQRERSAGTPRLRPAAPPRPATADGPVPSGPGQAAADAPLATPKAMHQTLHETLAAVRRLEDPTGSNADALMQQARYQLRALEAALDPEDPRAKRTLVQATERLAQTEQWIARTADEGR